MIGERSGVTSTMPPQLRSILRRRNPGTARRSPPACGRRCGARPAGVGDVLVGAGADHELALVGLADVGVHGVGHDDAREHRLDRLRHQRLQREALERQRKPATRHDDAGVAGGDDADVRSADISPRGLDAATAPLLLAPKPHHLAVLDDVDAHGIRGARVAPRHRVVARHAPAPLQGRAHHGMAHLRRYVERRAEGLACGVSHRCRRR